MSPKLIALLALMAATHTVAGCTTLVVGGAGLIIADEVMEQDGDDGLF